MVDFNTVDFNTLTTDDENTRQHGLAKSTEDEYICNLTILNLFSFLWQL